MEIYLDLEKTILKNDHSLSKNSLVLLENLCKDHCCTILTNGALWEAKDLFSIPNLQIVSTMENAIYMHYEKKCFLLKDFPFQDLAMDEGVYTLYATSLDTCYIAKYQERLKAFYPTPKLKLCSVLPEEIGAIQMVVFLKDLERILKKLNGLYVETLFSDRTKAFLNITACASTKEAWLLKLKKSPAIGIGDSLTDYEFIKHCEIQIAMQNGEDSLKKLCPLQTTTTNEDDGALEFIDSYLKHQRA